MSETVLHYINGKKTSGSSTRKADVFNPALGEKTAEVVMGVAADVDAAVQACLLYTSPSPRDNTTSRMPSSA